MNRILFEKGEIAGGVATFGGARAEHVLDVLHGVAGQTLKTGEIDGLAGTSEIVEARRLGDGTATVTVRVSHCERAPEPWFDLLLAPPRPRVLKRLLPQLAALGVGTLVLAGAKKTEKDFWGATLLKEENWRPLFVDGLMQCGATAMPHLVARRSLRRFVADELDAAFPSRRRIVAHPYGAPATARTTADGQGRLLLAIGPEGGWTDDEVEMLEEKGFCRRSLGPRILRTDTAAVALVAQLMAEEGRRDA